KQIVVEPVRCRQPLAPDRLHRRERLVELPLGALDRRERVVGPAVVLAGVADVGGELGKLRHPVLPVHTELLVQAGAVAQAPRVRDQLGVALAERARRRGGGPLGDCPCEGAERTREGYDADTDHGSSYGRSGAGGRTSAARGTIAATLADRRALLSDGKSRPSTSRSATSCFCRSAANIWNTARDCAVGRPSTPPARPIRPLIRSTSFGGKLSGSWNERLRTW